MSITFLREGSIKIHSSVEGDGHRIGIEDYPFQQLAIQVQPYDYEWLALARFGAVIAKAADRSIFPHHRAGEIKHANARTPLGTSVATLAREGHDMLAAPCGYCGRTGCLGACSQPGGHDEDH